MGGLEHYERSTRDERGVYSTKKPYVTRIQERCVHVKCVYRMLTAESFLQASELHGCPVGREPNVVQVG